MSANVELFESGGKVHCRLWQKSEPIPTGRPRLDIYLCDLSALASDQAHFFTHSRRYNKGRRSNCHAIFIFSPFIKAATG